MLERPPPTSAPGDLHALIRVASRVGATLSIRDTVAHVIDQALEHPNSASSIFDSIPPLSHLRVEVFPARSKELETDVLGEMRRELPWVGFFSPKRTVASDLNENLRLVRLSNKPRVLIVPDVRALAAVMAAHAGERLVAVAPGEEGTVLVERVGTTAPMRIDWRDGRPPWIEAYDALQDLINLAAEMALYGGSVPLEDRDGVVSSLNREAKQITNLPHLAHRAWDLALPVLRYLAARGTGDKLPGSVFEVLNALNIPTVDSRFSSLLVALDKEEPFRAVVVPEKHGNVRIQEFTLGGDQATSALAQGSQWKQVEQAHREEGLRISPPVGLDVPELDWCCRYRDFSRGVAEVIWSDVDGPVAEQRLPVVYLPEDREFVFGSGYFSAPGAASLRLDYGFLSSIYARLGRVEVAAVWKPKEATTPPSADASKEKSTT